MSNFNEVEKKEISDYIKKVDKIEHILIGTEGTNGLRSKVKDIEKFIEDLKPQLINLTRIYNSVEDIKRSIYRVFWVILTSSIIALGSRFVQIKIQDKTQQEVLALREDEKQSIIYDRKNAERQQEAFSSLKNQIKNKK